MRRRRGGGGAAGVASGPRCSLDLLATVASVNNRSGRPGVVTSAAHSSGSESGTCGGRGVRAGGGRRVDTVDTGEN